MLQSQRTRSLTVTALLCALTYLVMAVGRIPVVLFLKYDPSDVVVTLGGLIWGPGTACAVSVIAAVLEMVTVSETGVLGCVMNIVQTLSFAGTACLLCRRRRTPGGAAAGLAAGCGAMAAVMLLWNYLITPIYMGYPRQAVAELLLPVFLPFNLLKGGLNGALTFLLYRPVTSALGRSGLIPPREPLRRRSALPLTAAGLAAISCVLLILSLNGTI